MNTRITNQKKVVKRSLDRLILICKEEGMNDLTIEDFKKGKSVIECKYCKTLNMVEVYKEKIYAMYECNKFLKTYLELFK